MSSSLRHTPPCNVYIYHVAYTIRRLLSNVNKMFHTVVSICHLSSSISVILLIFFNASTAATLFGLKALAFGLSWLTLGVSPFTISHCSSKGYRCCTGHSIVPFLVFSSTARIWPSEPGYSCWTTAKGNFPLFLSSVRTIHCRSDLDLLLCCLVHKVMTFSQGG